MQTAAAAQVASKAGAELDGIVEAALADYGKALQAVSVLAWRRRSVLRGCLAL